VFVGSDHGHKRFRKKIEQKIVKSGLEGKVKFVGMCKDMPVAYAISNLVISASMRPEAFGRIAIEAQSMKRVIIATNIGGSLETIIDGKTGFLVEAGNVEKMAAAIDEALALDKAASDKICNKARKHIEENFSSKKMCDETIKIYRKVLAE
jgi:glycosyltransferase involved in cell wall biosynthesis